MESPTSHGSVRPCQSCISDCIRAGQRPFGAGNWGKSGVACKNGVQAAGPFMKPGAADLERAGRKESGVAERGAVARRDAGRVKSACAFFGHAVHIGPQLQ
jgi:hypothetical protein